MQADLLNQDQLNDSNEDQQLLSTTDQTLTDSVNQQQTLHPPSSLKELKDKYQQANLLMENRIMPVDLLEEFLQVIEFFAEDPVNRLYPDLEYKRFFFGEFLNGIIKKLATVRDLEPEHQHILRRLLIALVEFFGQEIDRDNVEMADAMRWLFNQSCILHTCMFQSEENFLSTLDSSSIIDKFSPEELAWRKGLKEGDRIDAVKVDMEYNLRMWSKAQIILITNDILHLLFEDDLKAFSRKQLHWYSLDIAPYDTKSTGDDWRKELKVGDYIDAYDSTKAWYQSIIHGKVVIQDEGREVIKYRVGFKMYHPDGNKEDDDGRKYFGWSEKFDETIPAYSPRIQRFQTFAKVIGDSQKDQQAARYEEIVDDQMDSIIYQNTSNITVFAVLRRRNKSSLLVQFLNRFGEIGGYQKILDKISQPDNDATTIELVYFYIDAISAASSMYNKVFLENYVPKLDQAVRQKILTSNQAALRQAKKDRIDGIVQSLIGGLKGRLGLSYQEREHEMCLFNLQIASLLLEQPQLDKRIDGAKIIQDVSKTANLSTFTSATEISVDPSIKTQRQAFPSEVIKKLKEGRVLFQIFSKERGHAELVQRSEELLKLFITQNSLSHEELEYVWASTKLDETTRLELFKHFHELSSRLRENEILFIIDQLDQVPLNKIVMQEIELVHELAKRSRSSESIYGSKAIEYFWKIAFSSQDNLEKVIVNQAINAISDIIKNWDNEKKHSYVQRIISNLSSNIEGLLSLKMLKKILMNFQEPLEQMNLSQNRQNNLIDLEDIMSNEKQPQTQEKSSDEIEESQIQVNNYPMQYRSRSNYICHLEQQYNLMETFFQNFTNYIFKARSAHRIKCHQDPNFYLKSIFDTVLCEKFIHSEQISERLEFLKFVISNSIVEMQTSQLSVLWDELIVHALTVQDSEMFYKWLKEICNSLATSNNKQDMRALVEFFKEKLSKETHAFKTITQEGFNCVQSFFILVNEFSEKVIRIVHIDTVKVQKFTAFSNVAGKEFKSYSFNQNTNANSKQIADDDDPDFLINTEPENIDGLEAIWKISVDANEQRVYEKAMQLLVRLYSQTSFKMAQQLPQFDDQFLSKCIQQINENRKEIEARKVQPKEEYEKVEKTISAFSSITGTSIQRVLPVEERKILRYLQLIKEYIRQSERQGTLGVKSHQSLLRGELLHSIQMTTSLGFGKDSRKFEMQAQSNTTLWDFRIQVAKLNQDFHLIPVKDEDGSYKLNQMIIPDTITVYRYTGVTVLKDVDNGKTLGELRFKANEQLNAYENKLFCNQTIPLLNEDRSDLSENAKLVFTEVFKQFSIIDEDMPERRIMNRITCSNFIQSVTEEDLVKEDDLRVQGLFELHDNDKDNKILIEDFFDFYRECCQNKEHVVRDNLTALKFRHNLTQFREDLSKGILIYQQRKAVEDMPRYKLSSNQIFYESIFELLDCQQEIASSAWNLIKQMTTKPELLNKIKHLNQDPDFSWDQVIDSSSIYKILYTLQIVESMLEDIPESQKHSFDLIQEKSVWIERFLSIGGFQEILKLFEVSLKLISQKPVDLLTKFEKNFLEYMLKLIRIFILSAFAANDSTVYELLNLVKRTSSIQDKGDKQEIQKQPEEENGKPEDPSNKAEDMYTTPAKKLNQTSQANDVEPKQLAFNSQAITEDLLFGGNYVGVKDDNTVVEVKDGQNLSQKNQQSTQQRSLENENERFSELAKIMRETGLGETIIQKINFKDLQNEILEIISLILSKKEISLEDAMIMENNLSLWVAILIKNDDLINEFYKFERSEEKAGMFGVKNSDHLVVTGLYTYKSPRVREEFTNTLLCMASRVQRNQGRLILFYLLELLEKNFPREDQYYLTRESKAFFDLYVALIDEYIIYQKDHTSSDPEDKFEFMNKYDLFGLLRTAIEKLIKHQTKETKSSLVEDKTLIGYFNLIEKLVVYLQSQDKIRLQTVLNDTGLLHELFYEQLFFDPKSIMKLDNKCKTKESRAAGYQVLQKVIEALEPKELSEFLEDDFWGIIKDMKKPKSWNYVPSDNSKQSSSFCGIRNLGNICYMIAMLQQFFMVPQFRYQLLKAEDNSPPDIVKYKGMDIDDNMLRQLQRLFGYLELSEKQEFNPTEFCFSFKDYEGNPTNTAIQSDTQEFLNIFFDRLENILKPTSQRYLLDSVFGGNTCSQLICQSCGNIKNIKENFYNLSVPVKDRKGLDNSLSKMIEGSIINDYRCGACNEKVDVYKRTLIGETPNVLIVHLQRLVFNFDTFQNDKINTRFDFPNVLNLKEYSFKHIMNEEGKEITSQDEENSRYLDTLMSMEDQEFIYKLVGVIIHRGTGQHGHYWSLINTKRGSDELDESKPEWVQTERDTWREFNDESVKYFSFSDLKQEAFGGTSDGGIDIHDDEMSSYLFNVGGANSYGKSAYMLVYERQKKKDLIVLEKKPIITEEQQDQTLERADTANSRVDEGQQEELVQVQLPYRKVDTFVPDWIRAEISHENIVFLMDRYIYNESFFNLLKAIFKHISNKVLLCQHHYGLTIIPFFTQIKKTVMKIAHKSVFELLAYYYYNNQLSDIMNSFQSIIQFCDSSYSLSRGSNSILFDFLDMAYFQDSLNHFFKVAFECPDKTSRYYVCRMTSIIVNKVYKLWDEAENKETDALQQIKAQADSLIVHFVSALGESASYQNWSRLEQYLRMLYEIALGGHLQARRFLSSTDVIPHLIEFLLGNRSPNVKSGKQRKPLAGDEPYLEPIVELICHLTRYTLTKEMVKSEYDWNEINPLPSTLLGYDPTMNDRYHRFELSDQAQYYIFDSIFIDYIQYMGYNTIAVGNLLAHLSYNSFKDTRIICENQLRGISKNDFDRVKNYLDAVTQIVLVKDNLQKLKLEWIFGIAQPFSYDQIMSDSIENDNEPKTRIGVKVLFSIYDEVYSYRSYLNTNDNIDSLLHLLWRYKGRMDTFTVNCLLSLMNIITADDDVSEYFSNIPGPTYQYARYTDWIKPYLNEQLIDARKGYAGSFSQQKEENVIKALSLYEKYEKFLENKDSIINYQDQEENVAKINQDEEQINTSVTNNQSDSVEENVKNLIDQIVENSTKQSPSNAKGTNQKTQKVIICTPQPYIIVDCIQENNVAYFSQVGVQLVTQSLDCSYTKSEPTGKENLSIPKALFKNFSRGGDIGRTNYHKTREQELQAKCIDNYFRSQGIKNKAAKIHSEHTGGTGDDGMKIIQDDDKQWKKVNDQNVDDIDEEDTGYTQDKEDMNINAKDAGKQHNSGIDEGLDDEDYSELQKMNQQTDQNVDQNHKSHQIQKDDNKAQNLLDLDQDDEKQEPISYKINVLEEGQGTQGGMNEANNQDNNLKVAGTVNYNDRYEEHREEEEIEVETKEEEIVWPNGVFINQGLVLKYIATNTNTHPVKIALEFIDPTPEEDEDDYLYGVSAQDKNTDKTLLQERYNYPKGYLEYYLNPTQTKTLIFVQKVDPINGNQGTIEKYVKLSVVELDNHIDDNYDNNPQNNINSGSGQKNDQEMESQQLQVIDETEDQVDPQINVSNSNIQNVLDDIPQSDNEPILIDGLRECPDCTYQQDPLNINCEICDKRF